MLHLIGTDAFDLRKFAEALEKNCQEGVKWERRKLEWIIEEEKLAAENQKAAA